MRKLVMITGLMFLLWFLTLPVASISSAAPPPVLGDARLSLMQGDVVMQNSDTGTEWGAASTNMPLTPGTKLWAPETGRMEAQFFGGSYLRGDANTEVDITNLSMGSNGNTIQVGVPQGRIYVDYGGSNVQNSVFQVDTPGASVMAYGASRFEVDVDENGNTDVTALNGDVYVQSQTGSTKVDAGSMLSLGPDQAPELSPAGPEDAWLRWNISRDSALAYRGSSSRYLPPSLAVYTNDFDRHGHWVDTTDYGYVWTPSDISAGWAPYREGRWCWIGGDYVWVSYEPWGWAPYHYGRWSFIANIGWCWVPPAVGAVFWSPGFVAWVSTPTYVAWVPLAPGETYYGYGYYGPHSVNITNVNINNIQITNNYVNARYANAVTVVNHETFLTGRPGRVEHAPANPFLGGERVRPWRPDIKPVVASALPRPLERVSERALPPREIQTRVRQVEHRPAAVHQGVSVFKPGERVAPMNVTKVEHSRPSGMARKPEAGQPQVTREQPGRSLQRGEANRPPMQGGPVQPGQQQRQTAGPGHRETGVAPSFKGEQGQAPANRPAPNRELGAPSTQRGQSPVPQNRREQSTAPSTRNRQMGAAPQFKGEQGQAPVNRPAPNRELGAPSTQRGQSPTPQNRREQSTAPSTRNRQMGAAPQFKGGQGQPPANRPAPNRELGAPSTQRGQSPVPQNRREQSTAPSTRNRQMGAAPQFKGGQGQAPASSAVPERQMTSPPQQRKQPASPPARRESPPQSMARPPAQRPQTAAPSVHRETGLSPQFRQQPAAPSQRQAPTHVAAPAASRPQPSPKRKGEHPPVQ